jgi:hypothetical protein
MKGRYILMADSTCEPASCIDRGYGQYLNGRRWSILHLQSAKLAHTCRDDNKAIASVWVNTNLCVQRQWRVRCC